MSQPVRYLGTKLSEPLPTTDGGVLRTIDDACRYMTKLTNQREIGQAWRLSCKLILNRASADKVTRQLSLALLVDAKLDLRQKTKLYLRHKTDRRRGRVA